ncbi:MAG TPA: hypothetical protein VE338_06715, partial [Ktedonobacterales bacterium]|nr:hypothetical protein [Ktedonobacterales bacterium]
AVMRLSLTQSAPAQAVTYYRAYRAALIWRYGVSEATLTLPSVEVQRLFSSAVSAVENAATPASSGVERSLPTSSGDRVTGRTADAQAPPTTLSR